MQSAARSNFFAVKDPEAFVHEMNSFDLFQVQHDGNGRFCLLHVQPDRDWGRWPSISFDPETGEEESVEFFAIIAGHLREGEVAVFFHVSADKLRSIVGEAVAVNSAGQVERLSLQDIYERARTLGPSVQVF